MSITAFSLSILYFPLLNFNPFTFLQMSDNDESKKRTRVTPAQLTVLEETFSRSATPDSKMRKQLAYKLEMPERSIQIWFQNRRAKVKMLQKRAILRQEQEAARARICAEASFYHKKMPAVQRAWSTDMVIPPPPPPPLSMLSFDPYLPMMPKSDFMMLASSVTVGSWHRMKIQQQDLLLFYDLQQRTFSWHIQDSNYHFKMMISFDTIAAIELNILKDQISAQIDMDLLEPPIFFMENGNNHWVQCSDFTEGTQASIVLRHTIRGLAADLYQALNIASTQDPKLRLVTQFPSPPLYPMDYQPWRHQSLPLTSPPPNEFWITPP